jgi:hypothetical protein
MMGDGPPPTHLRPPPKRDGFQLQYKYSCSTLLGSGYSSDVTGDVIFPITVPASPWYQIHIDLKPVYE